MDMTRARKALSDLGHLRWRLAYKGVLVGVVAGLLAALYRGGIDFCMEKALWVYRYLGAHPAYIPLWVLFACAVGYLIYRLEIIEPYAKGSGIPQVEAVARLGVRMRWYTVLLVRFVAGLGAMFFGVSLGKGGTSIAIGAAGAQAIEGSTKDGALERRLLTSAGAAAGLSTAFNAPLAGVVFALEQVHRSFSPKVFIAAASAALTADVVSKVFFGLKPVLNNGDIAQLPLPYYALLIPLGLIAGLIGWAVNRGLLQIGGLYKKIPAFARPAVALLCAIPLGLLLPGVLGGGQGLVTLAEGAGAGIGAMLVLLAVKFAFTCLCFGSGIPGGLFMPIFSMGALVGAIFGLGLSHLGAPAAYIPAFCVCAMAGVMAGAIKAPVSSVLLVAEMTGSLMHFLPLAIVAFIALLTADVLKAAPIYDVLLERMIGEKRADAEEGKSGTIVECPVELGSVIAGKRLRDVVLPAGAIIAQINRAEAAFVPNAETRILNGDYLIFLASNAVPEEASRMLTALCSAADT